MLQVRNLTCERGQKLLFRDLEFSVAPGEIVQVQGPNGSGKSTLLKILCGLYAEFEGEVEWKADDYPLYLGHRPGVKDLLTVEENLRWLCELQSLRPTPDQTRDMLKAVSLLAQRDTPCGSLSEGQRKRVNLARFFHVEREAWLLDEPFSALDAAGTKSLEARMSAQAAAGGVVLFSSHQPVNMDRPVRQLELIAS